MIKDTNVSRIFGRSILPVALLYCLSIQSSCQQQVSPKKYETRAVWLSRFEYAQDKSTQESKAYIANCIKKFAGAGINTLIFQVRGNADAFYQSAYEPWSQMLSDTLGKNPGWDPLAFAIETSGKYGLQLHAWLNTFPAWRANESPPEPSDPLHPLLAHPEWVVCDSAGQPMRPKEGYITFSPGHPQVQKHIQKVVLDIVEHYDVDGIHFDYIRYPEYATELGYSHDPVSWSRFNSASGNPASLAWNNWQREQINLFTEKTYNLITEKKPWVTVSAAVIGFHHGRNWNGYGSVFQDVRRWMAIGKIDIVCPMTYVPIGHPRAPFEGALEQWRDLRYLGRPVFPGIAVYKVGAAFSWNEIWKQVELVKKEDFAGMVFFSSNGLLDGLTELKQQYFNKPSLPVPMTWKKSVPPEQPAQLTVQFAADTLFVSWQIKKSINYYVLYYDSITSDVNHIIALYPGSVPGFAIETEVNNISYYLTAVNRIGLESEAIKLSSELNIKK